jgi:DNA mismatch repair protein MutS2
MTPLSHDPAPPKTRSDLEWHRVLDAVAARCSSVLGQDLAHDLPFEGTRAGVRAALAESREARELFDRGEPLPVFDLPDVREAMGRLRVGAVLSPHELFAMSRLLERARTLRRFLASHEERCPTLAAVCSTDPTLDRVARDVGDAFDPDGTLKDDASPRLKELRIERATAKNRMVSRLEELLRSHSSIVQDAYVTEREGRFVIPVRADAHERFPGIVHAASGSGATLFVEPRVVIPLGNRLKVLNAEVAREEEAIYAKLSSALVEHLVSIEGAAHALARADVRAATAKLAYEAKLSFPVVVDEPHAKLLSARHVLLVLDGVTVVPSDIETKGGRALVVSGPNAGGKTVALKSLGLAVLSVRAGLPIAADGGSSIGIFDVVLTDVGDEQSIEKNLSTFSAQMKNLARIIDDAREGALVLLDEVATGTDPREGEALAAGILDSLTARGAAVLVTTHYEGLKALALVRDRFDNASVGFDIKTMSPTFKLAMGVPGSSSALAVAERFGIPSTVIERAKTFLTKEAIGFEELMKKLELERAALELARAHAEERGRAAEAERARLEAEVERVREKRREEVEREALALAENVRRARDDIKAARARLRQKNVEPHEIAEIERGVNKIAAEVGAGGSLEPGAEARKKSDESRAALALSELKKGKRVYVPRLRAEAEILDVSGENVRVAAGALKLTVSASELQSLGGASQGDGDGGSGVGAQRGGRGKRLTESAGLEVAIQTSDNTVDVRGLNSDDAVSMTMTFLDRAVGSGQRVAFVVHGHGTGALRDAIRRELKASRYVAYFRPGEQNEGGDGATVVWLA